MQLSEIVSDHIEPVSLWYCAYLLLCPFASVPTCSCAYLLLCLVAPMPICFWPSICSCGYLFLCPFDAVLIRSCAHVLIWSVSELLELSEFRFRAFGARCEASGAPEAFF